MKTLQQMIRITHDCGASPYWIAKILGCTEQQAAEEATDYENALNRIEEDYIKNELPKVQQALKEMRGEVSETERFEMRRRYLLGQLQELKSDPQNPKLKRVMLEIKIFTGKLEGISSEMVVKAREFPITELIKSHRGMAKCPFHPDKTPSMDIRNNFYHCYSGCGSGDVIDLVMKMEGLTFRQAVARLS